VTNPMASTKAMALVVQLTSRKSSRENSRRKTFASSRLGDAADSSAASAMNGATASSLRFVVIRDGFCSIEKNASEMSVSVTLTTSPSVIAM